MVYTRRDEAVALIKSHNGMDEEGLLVMITSQMLEQGSGPLPLLSLGHFHHGVEEVTSRN